jgi:nucleoside-diphosphate-sugar epimerase
MKILLIGATGFIGSVLAKALLQTGYSVSAITRDEQKLNKIDIRLKPIIIDLTSFNPVDVKITEFDLVFNCAGEVKNYLIMRAVHVDATKKLLSMLTQSNTRWVQLSSVGVYDQRTAGTVSENSKFLPIGEYESTKAEAEIFVKNYCLEQGIDFTILRPSNVFSNDMPNNSLRQLIKAIKTGMFFYMGNPNEFRATYVHVDVVVAALIKCGFDSKAINQDFILSDSLSQREFVTLVCDLCNKRVPLLRVPQALIRIAVGVFGWLPNFPLTRSRVDALTNKTIYSNNKIESILKFKHPKTLHETLKEFILKN